MNGLSFPLGNQPIYNGPSGGQIARSALILQGSDLTNAVRVSNGACVIPLRFLALGVTC